jgi:hypothetical protein
MSADTATTDIVHAIKGERGPPPLPSRPSPAIYSCWGTGRGWRSSVAVIVFIADYGRRWAMIWSRSAARAVGAPPLCLPFTALVGRRVCQE